MPPRPSHPSTSNAEKATSSSASSTMESTSDDPKNLELREFAVTALESFEMQAIVAVTNNMSLAMARRQLLQSLIGISEEDDPPPPPPPPPANGDDETRERDAYDDEDSFRATSSKGPRN
ncbi:hypothetical protein Dda_4508 [Drechslerella dactyloides]|uniref:Uncharacterized protein n=1 Tax=Drechslerella dactyloides TaxID=74499 RepID=A0AAD6IX22_DREDA|nr:hypothetical protein Dda_4508 [Drechslerella dactyloides]